MRTHTHGVLLRDLEALERTIDEAQASNHLDYIISRLEIIKGRTERALKLAEEERAHEVAALEAAIRAS